MKNLFYLFLISCVLVATGCGDDDEMMVDDREKFLGTYQAADQCSITGVDNYSVTITAGAGPNEVNISNFWDVTTNPTTATVSGDEITIPRQDPDNDQVFASGSGTINGNVISLDFTMETAFGDDVCSSRMTK